MKLSFFTSFRRVFPALLLAFPGALFAGGTIAPLVGEDAQLFFSVRSLPELREAWTDHAIRKSLDEAGLTEARQTMKEAGATGEGGFTATLKNEFGLTVDKLFELFPGGAGMALFNLTDLVAGKAKNPDLLIVAEFSGSAERLEELMQIQFERNAEAQKQVNPEMEHVWVRETFMGETLHFDEAFDGERTYVEDGYALVDGIFLLGAPESRLRAAVEQIKGEGGPPLSSVPGFLRTRESLDGAADATFYAHLSEIMPEFDRLIRDLPAGSGLAMLGINPDSLADALALGAMEAFAADLVLGERDVVLYSGLLWEAKRGLLSLLTYGAGDLPEAAYVPKGVAATSVSRFDLAAMLARLEDLLGRGSPNLPALFEMQLQNVKQQTGVDLRLSVLDNLGDEIVSLSAFDEVRGADKVSRNPQEVYVIELRDGSSFSAAMEAFKDLVPGLRARLVEQAFEGQTIYTVKGATGPDAPHDSVNDFSYTVKRSHLFFSSGGIGLLQEVLSRFEGGGADGFWASPETEAMFEPIARPAPISRSFMDIGRVSGFFVEAFMQGLTASGIDMPLDSGDLRGLIDMPLVFVAESNEAEDGVFSRGAIRLRQRD